MGAVCARAGKHALYCWGRHFSPDESISSHTSSHTMLTSPPLEADLLLYLHVVRVKAREVGMSLDSMSW